MTQVKFRAFLLMLSFWLFSSLLLSQTYFEDVPDAVLPSVETSSELGQLPSDRVVPGLRAKPTDVDGSEKPQKTPIGDFGFFELSGLLVLLSFYGFYRRLEIVKGKKI